jgi:hypothetical protein
MGVVCTNYGTKAYKILVETLQRKDHLRDLGLNGKITSKWSLKK